MFLYQFLYRNINIGEDFKQQRLLPSITGLDASWTNIARDLKRLVLTANQLFGISIRCLRL
jgi:hypothetical protein